jgi:hypothetical protein
MRVCDHALNGLYGGETIVRWSRSVREARDTTETA